MRTAECVLQSCLHLSVGDFPSQIGTIYIRFANIVADLPSTPCGVGKVPLVDARLRAALPRIITFLPVAIKLFTTHIYTDRIKAVRESL
jgi:hypothetical protein